MDKTEQLTLFELSGRTLRDLPIREQPASRLALMGPQALSTAELLSIFLGGDDLGVILLANFGGLHGLMNASEAQLQRVKGVGEAVSRQIKATLELARRLQEPKEELPNVSSPANAAALLMPMMRYLPQEEMRVLLLNTRNGMIGQQTIYRGSLNTAVVRIGEIFKPAVEAQAAAIIIAHNHPSGDPSPSPQDISTTRRVVESGKLLNIDVLDHLIIGDGRFISLKERGLGF